MSFGWRRRGREGFVGGGDPIHPCARNLRPLVAVVRGAALHIMLKVDLEIVRKKKISHERFLCKIPMISGGWHARCVYHLSPSMIVVYDEASSLSGPPFNPPHSYQLSSTFLRVINQSANQSMSPKCRGAAGFLKIFFTCFHHAGACGSKGSGDGGASTAAAWAACCSCCRLRRSCQSS